MLRVTIRVDGIGRTTSRTDHLIGQQHVQEMELILKYSPFRTDAQFMKEFDKIEGTSGSSENVYNCSLQYRCD